MRPSFDQLAGFGAVAELGSFTKAAECLAVSKRLHAQTALAIEEEQELEQLMLNVAKIDATLAKILVMAICEEKTNVDIARELNWPVREVKNGKKRLFRAVKRIYAIQAASVSDMRTCRRARPSSQLESYRRHS